MDLGRPLREEPMHIPEHEVWEQPTETPEHIDEPARAPEKVPA